MNNRKHVRGSDKQDTVFPYSYGRKMLSNDKNVKTNIKTTIYFRRHMLKPQLIYPFIITASSSKKAFTGWK